MILPRYSLRVAKELYEKTALHDIQKTPNIICNQIDAVDAETKWEAVELMLASSASTVALVKKTAKLGTKNSTCKISVPKINVINQPVQQPRKPAANDTAGTAIKPITIKKPSPNKQIN